MLRANWKRFGDAQRNWLGDETGNNGLIDSDISRLIGLLMLLISHGLHLAAKLLQVKSGLQIGLAGEGAKESEYSFQLNVDINHHPGVSAFVRLSIDPSIGGGLL